jgi:hypothetical protein
METNDAALRDPLLEGENGVRALSNQLENRVGHAETVDFNISPAWEETMAKECNDAYEESNHMTAVHVFPLPKIMKNDIRRYFARMFMNTINSAELNKIQSYFQTFMVGPCKFIAEHQASANLHLPDRMVTAGPWLISHYVLGCFVQYPDLVLRLKNSRIVTSSGSPGSKIVMDLEVQGTKIHDLELVDWIPKVNQIQQQHTTEEKLAKKRRKPLAAKLLPAVGSDNHSEPVIDTDAVANASVAVGIDSVDTVDCSVKEQSGTELPVASLTGSATTELINKDTKRASAGTKRRGSKAFQEAMFNISEAQVHALFAKASLLPTPIAMTLGGTITLFLDDSNHVQHMSLSMKQIK